MHPVLHLISDEVLVRDFGPDAVHRGRAYAADGSVVDVAIRHDDDEGVEAQAHVRGSRGRLYVVAVAVFGGAEWCEVMSHCTCPVVRECKHGAAVAMVLSRQAGGPQREEPWERALAALVADLEPPEVGARKRLAIRADLRLPGHHHYGPVRPGLRLRLLHQGARENWIKTGITWSDVPMASLRGTYDPGQLDVLARLHAGIRAVGYYSSSVEEPELSEFSRDVTALLVEAAASGIELVPGDNLAAFAVAPEPTDLSADIVTSEDSVRLRLSVIHAGEHWHGERVATVGRPARAVLLIDGDAPHHAVTVVALRRPVPALAAKTLESTESVEVPAAARQRLLTAYLPQLTRHVELSSSDGSVAIPDAPLPTLRLTVEWSGPSLADLHWEFVYATGPQSTRCTIDSSERLGGVRDRDAEKDLLDRLPLEQHPAAREGATGPDALRLATEALPALRASGLVDVVERGRPDFREAEGGVEIAFDVVPAEGDPTAVDWLDLRVVITIDGEAVPLPHVIEALTLGHDQIVLPSGLYVATDRPEFTRLHELLQAAAELSEQQGDRLSVGAHDLGVWAQLDDLGVVDAQAAEWVGRARALRDLVELPRPEPQGIASTLRSYQEEGFRWLAFLWQHGLGGVLADDMGLGKTLQVLALVAHARAAGDGPFLVVAPSSVVSAWQSEAARHAPDLVLRAVTASVSRRGARIADAVVGADLVVTTYTLLRLEAEQYGEVAWGGVVLDEAQQVKNHQGKTYRAVRTLEAPFKLAVTGTPFENRLMELWSLLSIVAPGLYPTPRGFTQHVAGPVEKRGDEAALRRFRQRVRPFMLRRTKELVAADLPAKQEQVLEVQLGPKHRRVYDTHLQKERQKILGLVEDFEQNRVAIFSALTRLRQLALAPGLVDPDQAHLGSAKLDTLVEHLQEISAEGHRSLVFSQFTSYLRQVRERLDAEGIETSYLDGATRDRGAVIEDFKTGTAPVFLISLKAGGVGLTLTEADYVFVLDPWWNPATEAQAVDRAHRIGQQKPVMVYRLVSADTIEEKVMELKARKAALFAQVVDGDGLMSTSIDADDIRALFAQD